MIAAHLGVGLLGLGDYMSAQAQFGFVLTREPQHLGAVVHKTLLDTTFWQMR